MECKNPDCQHKNNADNEAGINRYLIFFMSVSRLESVSQVNHAVCTVCIVLLRILRESVRTCVAR